MFSFARATLIVFGYLVFFPCCVSGLVWLSLLVRLVSEMTCNLLMENLKPTQLLAHGAYFSRMLSVYLVRRVCVGGKSLCPLMPSVASIDNLYIL